jgi:hypothetical protein
VAFAFAGVVSFCGQQDYCSTYYKTIVVWRDLGQVDKLVLAFLLHLQYFSTSSPVKIP